MSDLARTNLGQYRISRELGRGGMGVVFLAEDTRLRRNVAIKALPDALANDRDRLARFKREAQLLASLNHPGIAAVYALEEFDGRQFMVMEYVEGQTLSVALRTGRMTWEKAHGLVLQIVDALAAAHARGVIHRDLKSSNVMVTPQGKAKVLDFGLAYVPAEKRDDTGAIDSLRTVSVSPDHLVLSTPGRILGTAGYLSPEQARGQPADQCSDIFSLGCIIYEMLTGELAFRGSTLAESLGATLHQPVDWEKLSSDVPPGLRHVLARCLERDRERRFQDARDVGISMEIASQSVEREAKQQPKLPWGLVLSGVSTMALVALALYASFNGDRTRATNTSPVFASIDPAAGTIVEAVGDEAGPAVISPDGKLIVFAARNASHDRHLYLRNLNEAIPELLVGTDGGTFPFWSPDSNSVGYFDDRKLKRIDLATLAIRTLCDAQGGRGGAWLDDGTIVFAPHFLSGIFAVSADGGEVRQLTEPNQPRFTSHRWPSAIPGTNRFLFFAVNQFPEMREERCIFLTSTNGEEPIELIRTPFSGQFAAGKLLFVRDTSLFAAEIDVTKGLVKDEPKKIVADILGDVSTWNAGFSASTNGTLVYRTAPDAPSSEFSSAESPSSSEWTRALVVDRVGRMASMHAESLRHRGLSLAPNGLSAAVSARPRSDPSTTGDDLWIVKLFGEGTDFGTFDFGQSPSYFSEPALRLTSLPGDEVAPCWSPDGSLIAFSKQDGFTSQGLYVKPLDGGGERLIAAPNSPDTFLIPAVWSPDGRYLICRRCTDPTNYTQGDLVGISLEKGDIIELVVGAGGRARATVSPDGKWLAYDEYHNDIWEIYAIPFRPNAALTTPEQPGSREGTPRFRVSAAGGVSPKWSTQGDALFYIAPDRSLMQVTFRKTSEPLAIEKSQKLFSFPFERDAYFFPVPSDNFFVIGGSETQSRSAIRLLMNWPDILSSNEP